MENRVQFFKELLEKQEDFYLDFVENRDMNDAPLYALEFWISADLTPEQYASVKQIFDPIAPGIYVPYACIEAWLQSCSPPNDFLEEIPGKVRVELQALMQHSAERIIEMNVEEIENNMECSGLEAVDMKLFCTWSLDCAMKSLKYGSRTNDRDVLSASVTPIQMIMNNDMEKPVWFNAMPQSIRFCRPILLQYVTKNINMIRSTKLVIEKEIANLKQIRVILSNGKIVYVNFSLTLSMTEENALEYIPEASKTENCPVCGATPDEMNKMEVLEVQSNGNKPPYYSFTPLYIWVRFFEFLLEISFRLEFQQWEIVESTRDQFKQRRQTIIKQIFEKFDDPEHRECKSGVITQRAFSEPAKLSGLLGIDEELIVRLRNVAVALNVADPINPAKLDIYCKETYRHYLGLYSWCRIPAAVHQVLAHGAEISIHAPAPLAFVAEEAAAPRYMEIIIRQTHHGRGRNRRDKLKGVFQRALQGTDPIISSCWIQGRRRHRYDQRYPEAVMDILMYEDEGSDPEEGEYIPMNELLRDVRDIDIPFKFVE